MNSHKDDKVTTIDSPAQVATRSEIATSHPTTAETRIHWASDSSTLADPAELERRFEAMRSRNWITDKMVQQYQKHWHCTREAALERLMAKAGR